MKAPIFLSVGRLAKEKNQPPFLSLNLPGTKDVAGDGREKPSLQRDFPDAVFLGETTHDELGAIYAACDVFVFPSLTDTFGLVLIEAMAAGLPVAAFLAPGPQDVVGGSGAGVMSADLKAAALAALSIERSVCVAHAGAFSWEKATDQFIEALVPVNGQSGHRAGVELRFSNPRGLSLT